MTKRKKKVAGSDLYSMGMIGLLIYLQNINELVVMYKFGPYSFTTIARDELDGKPIPMNEPFEIIDYVRLY